MRYSRSKALLEIVDEDGLFELLLQRWRVEDRGDRKALLKLLVAMAQGRAASLRTHFRLSDMRVCKVLVMALDDADPGIRASAATWLCRDFDEGVLRFHAMEIVDHVKKHTNTDAILLLGRTGAPEARMLLQDEPQYPRTSAVATDLALARLGDAERRGRLTREFLTCTDARKQAQLATDLGYVGGREACRALASQLRTHRVLRGAGTYSLRITIIDALSLALPWEQVLWKPMKSPTDDSYYAGIEQWAESVLDIAWEEERPPFFYRARGLGRPWP